MTYDELKRRYIDEGLNKYAFVSFGSRGGGYNSVCIFREGGAFSVWFCDERGAPFSEHNGLSEADACEMVYSHAVDQKDLELYREEKRSKEKAENPEHTEQSANQFLPPLHAEKKDAGAGFFSRVIKRILDAVSLEAMLAVIGVIALIILFILYRLVSGLNVSPAVTCLILLGIVLVVFIGFRSYLRKKKATGRKHRT